MAARSSIATVVCWLPRLHGLARSCFSANFGIVDNSAGSGTSGTPNSYARNVCGRGNAAARSSPAGLRR